MPIEEITEADVGRRVIYTPPERTAAQRALVGLEGEELGLVIRPFDPQHPGKVWVDYFDGNGPMLTHLIHLRFDEPPPKDPEYREPLAVGKRVMTIEESTDS